MNTSLLLKKNHSIFSCLKTKTDHFDVLETEFSADEIFSVLLEKNRFSWYFFIYVERQETDPFDVLETEFSADEHQSAD